VIDKLPANIKAVLFDMDGVLIDSMPYHVSSWQKIFRDYNIEVSALALQRAEGEKAKITMRRIAKKHGINWSDEDLDRLVEKKRAIYRKIAPRGMRKIALDAVKFCRERGLQTAIVTGSVRPNLEWTLAKKERNLFDFILSSEYYKHSKPHPEPYLNAAVHLGVKPADCLVIENAPLGIQSALSAGMICLAITTTLPVEDLKAADKVISDLDQLKDLFVNISEV